MRRISASPARSSVDAPQCRHDHARPHRCATRPLAAPDPAAPGRPRGRRRRRRRPDELEPRPRRRLRVLRRGRTVDVRVPARVPQRFLRPVRHRDPGQAGRASRCRRRSACTCSGCPPPRSHSPRSSRARSRRSPCRWSACAGPAPGRPRRRSPRRGDPIFVSMFGHPMEDGLLTMALAVAFVWWGSARVLTGRWWPLLLAGLFVGVGFQAKMLQACSSCRPSWSAPWWPSPSRGRSRRTLGHVAVLVASALVASLAWSVVVELLPAADHPYVDGSTDDSVFAMLFRLQRARPLPARIWPGAVSTIGGAFARAARTWATPSTASAVAGTPAAARSSSCSHPGTRPRSGGRGPQHSPASGSVRSAGGPVAPAGRPAPPSPRSSPSSCGWSPRPWSSPSCASRTPPTWPDRRAARAPGRGRLVGCGGLVGAADRRLRVVPVALLVVQGAWWTWLARSSSEPVVLGAVAVGATIAALIALLVRWGGASVRPRGRGRRTAAALLVASVVLARRASPCRPSTRRGTAAAGTPRSEWAPVPSRSAVAPPTGVRTRPERHARADRSVVPSSAFRISAPDVWGGHSTLTSSERELVATAERAGGGRDVHRSS